MLKVKSDTTFSQTGPVPPDWSEFIPEIGHASTDIVIAKKQWGAFYGTDLELQLRRRGMDTIVLCGIATDYGVESTARFAYEFGFQQVFAEDAMSSMSARAASQFRKLHFQKNGPCPHNRGNTCRNRVSKVPFHGPFPGSLSEITSFSR